MTANLWAQEKGNTLKNKDMLIIETMIQGTKESGTM